jgi:hypothetical protein
VAIENALDHVWAVPQPDRHGFVKARARGLLLLALLGTVTVAATATVRLATAGAIAEVRANGPVASSLSGSSPRRESLASPHACSQVNVGSPKASKMAGVRIRLISAWVAARCGGEAGETLHGNRCMALTSRRG